MNTDSKIKNLYFQEIVGEIEDYAILLLNREGEIENWNKGAEKIKGYTADEVIGKHFRLFFTPADQKAHLPEKMLEKAAREGKVSMEGIRVRKSGETFCGNILINAIHDEAGLVVGFTKITRDLSQKKVSEEALRQSEDRYSKMIAEIQDYAILSMDINGNIENWNKGAERIKGYKAGEIIGKNFRQFYTPEDLKAHKPDRLIETALKKGRAQDEGWRLRKDGTSFWGSITITALHDDAGNTIGFSKVTRDLTEKLQTEKAVLYLQKMEAKNNELEQLTYITSHDLQEPLRNITSLIEIFTEDYGDRLDESATNILQFITDSSNRMRQLINGLLDYGRLGRNAVATTINCNGIAKAVCADLSTVIKETHTKITLEPLPELIGYETEFRLLLQNLISNAIKFRKPGINPEIKIWAEQKNGIWKFAIQDNGIGIPTQFQERIFIIFQRLHSSEYAGTGIGLAHCKRIVELHNGEIWVDSEPETGSTFHFTINTNSYFL